ncbi:MAG: hypothetical protein MHMPM18_003869 [Marteilia pararefringens]
MNPKELIHRNEHLYSERSLKDLNFVKNGSTGDSMVTSARSIILPTIRGPRGVLSRSMSAIEAFEYLYNQIRELLTVGMLTNERVEEASYEVHHEFMSNFDSSSFFLDSLCYDMLRGDEFQIQLRPNKRPDEFDYEMMQESLKFILGSMHKHQAVIKVRSSCETQDIIRAIEEAEKKYGDRKKIYSIDQVRKTHVELDKRNPFRVFRRDLLDSVGREAVISANMKYNFLVVVELNDKFRKWDCCLNPESYILSELESMADCSEYSIDSNFQKSNIHTGEMYCFYFRRQVSPIALKSFLDGERQKLVECTERALRLASRVKAVNQPNFDPGCSCFNRDFHEKFVRQNSREEIKRAASGRLLQIKNGINGSSKPVGSKTFNSSGLFFEFKYKAPKSQDRRHELEIIDREEFRIIKQALESSGFDKELQDFAKKAIITSQCFVNIKRPKLDVDQLMQILFSFIASRNCSKFADIVSTTLQSDSAIENNEVVKLLVAASPNIYLSFLGDVIDFDHKSLGNLLNLRICAFDSLFRIDRELDSVCKSLQLLVDQVFERRGVEWTMIGYYGSSCSIKFNLCVNDRFKNYTSLLAFPIFRVMRQKFRVDSRLGYNIIASVSPLPEKRESIDIYFDCPYYLFENAAVCCISMMKNINKTFRVKTAPFQQAYLSSYYQYVYDSNCLESDCTAQGFVDLEIPAKQGHNLIKSFLDTLEMFPEEDVLDLDSMKCISLISYKITRK